MRKQRMRCTVTSMNTTGTYVGSELVYDADSHVMELPDWLGSYADEATRGTDPHNPDTDGDGQCDGAEIQCGSSPLDPFFVCT